MPNRNKQKGNRVEREVVNIAKEHGIVAKRAYASDGRSLGMSEKVDVLVGSYAIQVKSRKKFPQWLLEASSEVDAVLFKENRQDMKIMLDYTVFLKLIGGVKQCGNLE